MQDDFIECPELAGKTIQALRIYRDSDGTNITIQLTDGTNFVCSTSLRAEIKASRYIGGVGDPEILRTYTI